MIIQKYLRKVSNAILIFIFLFSTKIFANEENELLLIKLNADNLFENEFYYNSITEYKRLLYFDKDSVHFVNSNEKIGDAYSKGGFFDLANYYYEQALLKADSVVMVAIQKKIIRNFISEDNLKEAIEKMKFYSFEEVLQKDLIGILKFKEGDFEGAKRILDNKFLINLCNLAENESLNPYFSKLISYFLPGFGRIYAGEYLSGIIDLSWNILSGYFTIRAFSEERELDGILIGSLVWLRFYRGNIQGAVNTVEIENKRIKEKYYFEMKNYYRDLLK